MSAPIRLGLIGDNIAASQAPKLHRLAGRQSGRAVSYDRLVPRELGLDFDGVFAGCAMGGYRGVNVTYPYKEIAAARVAIEDPLVRAIGAVNTIVFEPDGARGFNTDHSGFLAAYRAARGGASPGRTLLIGAGGVGKAVAFGLGALGAREIAVVDRDGGRAAALCAVLRHTFPSLEAHPGGDASAMAAGVTGVINCTPVGMTGMAGTPIPRAALAGAEWAFDAVYTPVDTAFLHDAAAEGLAVISGYELFVGQGVDAWRLFTGLPLDEAALREALLRPEEGA